MALERSISSDFFFDGLEDFDLSESLNVLLDLDLSILPGDFIPNNYCVLCGKGKEYFDFVGNRRFRTIVGMNLDRYNRTNDKVGKSTIVSEILRTVHSAGGIFCRFEQGVWCQVSEGTAREKVGALFRDCLHTKYRSSGKAKVEARRRAKIVSRAKDSASKRRVAIDLVHV
jgi:hypothetical protein